MNKEEIRKQYTARRRQYSAEEVQWKSLQITMQFFSFFSLEKARCLHAFLPIARQNEIDTWPIIQRMGKNYPAIEIAIPKADLLTYAMESYLYQPGMALHTNKWGMSEPQDARLIEPEHLDIILLPLLAFDKKGYRVGYGKGFYDRYLARCRQDVLKVGLSMEEPIEEIREVDMNDVKMDYCVTPEKVWQFS
jgi:5-formyltetrahydrofolate cyclo-ligase